jgi:gamma-glutamyltranspeptidase
MRLALPGDTEAAGTSHISIVDAQGNVASMTTTIEATFGSRIMVRGFLLNNELTDFDFVPGGANEIAPGKRPRSSMAPTIVFATDGTVRLAVGSWAVRTSSTMSRKRSSRCSTVAYARRRRGAELRPRNGPTLLEALFL